MHKQIDFMTPIDLLGIAMRHDILLKDLAEQLFPDNKHPMAALKRAIDGKTSITAQQIVKLADLLGVSIDDLFDVKGWKGSYLDGVHVFTRGPYKAHLRVDKGRTIIFKDGEQVSEMILHTGAVRLSDYIKQIEHIIDTL